MKNRPPQRPTENKAEYNIKSTEQEAMNTEIPTPLFTVSNFLKLSELQFDIVRIIYTANIECYRSQDYKKKLEYRLWNKSEASSFYYTYGNLKMKSHVSNWNIKVIMETGEMILELIILEQRDYQ